MKQSYVNLNIQHILGTGKTTKCMEYFRIYYNVFLQYFISNMSYYEDVNSNKFIKQINKYLHLDLSIAQHMALLVTSSIQHSYIHNTFHYTSQIIPRKILYKESDFSVSDFIFPSGDYNTDLYIHVRFPNMIKYIEQSFYNNATLIEDIKKIHFYDDVIYDLLHYSKIGLIIQE